MFVFRPTFRLFTGLLMAFYALAAFSSAAEINQLQQAQQAYQRKQPDQLLTIANSMGSSAAAIYPRYWEMQLRVANSTASEQTISQFIARHPNTYAANRLLSDWLKQQGRNQNWSTVSRYFGSVVEPDAELNCYGWRAQMHQGDTRFTEDAQRLWERSLRSPAACQPVFNYLAAQQVVTPLQTMERVYLLWRMKQETAARSLAMSLPVHYRPSSSEYDTLMKNPSTVFYQSSSTKGAQLLAALRLSLNNPTDAARSWPSSASTNRFTPDEQALFWNIAGFEASKRLMPEAASWFLRAPANTAYRPKVNELAAWKARAGLRNREWKLVEIATEQMNPSMAALPDWIYWRAKAMAMNGKTDSARTLWTTIAQQPVYYGILASEEIGQPFKLPGNSRPSQTDLQWARLQPSLQRSLLLYAAGIRSEGLGEWHWAVKNMNDSQRLAAAEIAMQQGLYDRAISVADQTESIHNYQYRYPMPYRSDVRQVANNMGVPEPLIYGLIRQESRFVNVARSSAGASGLMQLMPATATWTAKRIGIKNFTQSQVNDINTNLRLGTGYLSYVMGRFDNQLPLAYAAYNAGPGRPNQWRASITLDGPAYIETIPFDETRDYVKKVLANVYLYEMVMRERATPIKVTSGSVSGK